MKANRRVFPGESEQARNYRSMAQSPGLVKSLRVSAVVLVSLAAVVFSLASMVSLQAMPTSHPVGLTPACIPCPNGGCSPNCDYYITFNESGLPGGQWNVTLAGVKGVAAAGYSITFAEPNGQYSWVTPDWGTAFTPVYYVPYPMSGKVTVSNANIQIPITENNDGS